MNHNEVQARIAELAALIEEKETELARKANRCRELSAKRTGAIEKKRKFIARIKLDIRELTDEISNLKTELWGLQELNLPRA